MWRNLNLFWTPLSGCRLFSKRYPEFSVHRTKFVVLRFCKQGRYFVGGVDVWTQCPPLTPFLIRALNQPVWGFPLFCTCMYTIFQSFISIYVWNISGIDIHVKLITSRDFVVLSVIFACCNLTAAGILWVALPLWFSLCTLCVMSCIKYRFADANITLSRIFCVSSNKIWWRESFSEDH